MEGAQPGWPIRTRQAFKPLFGTHVFLVLTWGLQKDRARV